MDEVQCDTPSLKRLPVLRQNSRIRHAGRASFNQESTWQALSRTEPKGAGDMPPICSSVRPQSKLFASFATGKMNWTVMPLSRREFTYFPAQLDTECVQSNDPMSFDLARGDCS